MKIFAWLLHHAFVRMVIIMTVGISLSTLVIYWQASWSVAAFVWACYIGSVGFVECFITSKRLLLYDFERKFATLKTPEDFFEIAKLLLSDEMPHLKLFQYEDFCNKYQLDVKIIIQEVFDCWDHSDQAHRQCLELYLALREITDRYQIKISKEEASFVEGNVLVLFSDLSQYAANSIRDRKRELEKKYGRYALLEYLQTPLAAYHQSTNLFPSSHLRKLYYEATEEEQMQAKKKFSVPSFN
jgi:hypothetical protein